MYCIVKLLWSNMLFFVVDVFSFEEFSDFNKFFGPIFFVLYVIISSFILVNMFLSIVNDSFAVVKAESIEQTNQYELVSFIWNKFKRLIGFSSGQVDQIGGPVYAEGADWKCFFFYF